MTELMENGVTTAVGSETSSRTTNKTGARIKVGFVAIVATVATTTGVLSAPTSAGAMTTTGGTSGAQVVQSAPESSGTQTMRFGTETRQAFEKAVSTPQGRKQVLQGLQDSFGTKVKVGVRNTPGRMSAEGWNCGPVSCGLSSSGGWHFWIIASYATLLNTNLWALQPYCWGALVPELGPWGAGICLSVGWILNGLVSNWPRMTNHGVWMAIYPWGIQDGRY